MSGRIVGRLIIVALAVASFGAACTSGGSDSSTPTAIGTPDPAPPVPSVIFQTVPSKALPTLGPTDEPQALDVAKKSALFQALTADATYAEKPEVWYQSNLDPLGVVLDVDLQTPAHGRFLFPTAQYDDDLEGKSKRPYTSATQTVDVESTSGFYLQVNLLTDEIAAIIPKDGSKITYWADIPVPTVEPDDESQALNVAAQDSLFQALTAGTNYTEIATPWMEASGSLLGVILHFTLASPAHCTFVFPVGDYDSHLEGESDRPYKIVSPKVDVQSMTDFSLSVNLRTGEVAGIQPDLDSSQVKYALQGSN